MPPSAQIIVRQANGQSLVLSENDRIVKEVTIPCSSQRCPSRHGQKSPVSFTFNDQDPFPEAGDQFMSLILPERSPSNPGFPLPFCGPQCLRDYLVYQYFAPSSRTAGVEQKLDKIDERNLATDGLVQKTDSVEYHVDSVPATLPPNSGSVLRAIETPESISQADGEGLNPEGPRFL